MYRHYPVVRVGGNHLYRGEGRIRLVVKVTEVATQESAALRTDARCVWSPVHRPGCGEGLYQGCCVLRAEGESRGGSTVWTQVWKPRWNQWDLMSRSPGVWEGEKKHQDGAGAPNLEPRGNTDNVNSDTEHGG